MSELSLVFPLFTFLLLVEPWIKTARVWDFSPVKIDPWFEAKGSGARSCFGSPLSSVLELLVSVSFLGFWVCALLFTVRELG